MDVVENERYWFENAAEKRGEKRGTLGTYATLVADGILSLQDAADRMGLSKKKFQKKVKALRQK